MTQEQKYTVVSLHDGYEIRHYPSCVLAQVEMSGDFDTAGSNAFSSLFRFISGANQSGKKIAMTSPVLQQSSQSTKRKVWDEHTISFVLPADMTFDDAPAPTDGRVQLHRTADQLVAALRFSGRMSVENYETQMRRLQEYLTRDGYLPTDVARVARFNAPWTPGFMRRNEIQIPIDPVNK